MTVTDLMHQLNALGIEVFLDGDDVVIRPASEIPTDMIPTLKEHKNELREHLCRLQRECREQSYGLIYSDSTASDEELAELERRVKDEGFVLCYSQVLNDYVAFCRDEIDVKAIPAGFVPYSDSELRQLFGPDKPDLKSLSLIHHAKKNGLKVTGNYDEREIPGYYEDR